MIFSYVMLFVLLVSVNSTPNILKILTFQEFDGSILRTPACTAAVEYAVEVANNRSDILPNFKIELDIRNQGYRYPILANSMIIDYMDNTDSTSGSFLSPIIFGPLYGCEGTLLPSQALHLITFTTVCSGPDIAAKRQTLYRSIYASYEYEYPQFVAPILFLNQMNWSEVSVVGKASERTKLEAALTFTQVALKHNIKIIQVSVDEEFTAETLNNMKSTDTRIIVVILSKINLCMNFLCKAYQVGIRAPNYVFIFTTPCIVPVGHPAVARMKLCQPSILEEQMEISFWVGYPPNYMTIKAPTTTSLGYTAEKFRHDFSVRTKGKQLLDGRARYVCHDAMMAAVLALNSSEALLNREYGLSLTNFSTHPLEVSDTVNISAMRTNVQGILSNGIVYNNRRGIDVDLWAAQFDRYAKLNFVFKFTADHRSEWLSRGKITTNFSVHHLADPVWKTANGNPPKDLSSLLNIEKTCSTETMNVVFILVCTLLSLTEIVFVVLRIHRDSRESLTNYNHFTKLTVALVCVGLNVESILIFVGYCNVTLAVFAVFFVLLLSSVIDIHLHILKSQIKVSSQQVSLRRPLAVWLSIAMVPLPVSVALAIYLSLFNTLAMERYNFPSHFDLERDSYVFVSVERCTTINVIWIWIGALVNLLVNLASLWHSYSIKHYLTWCSNLRIIQDTRTLRMASVSNATIFVAMILIVVANQVSACNQQIAIAVGLLVFSASNGLTLLWPVYPKITPVNQLFQTRTRTNRSKRRQPLERPRIPDN